MQKTFILFTICSLLFFQNALAQPTLQKLKAQLQKPNTPVIDFSINQLMPNQASALFAGNANVPIVNIKDWLTTNLQLRLNTDLLVQKNMPVTFGRFEVQKLQQFYKGIKVEHGIINVTGKDGNTAMIQMEFYPVEDDFKTTPTLNEDIARQAAIKFIGAKRYAWQDTGDVAPLPKGELVIIADLTHNGKMNLAYKFDIYALQPLSRAYVYINASDGSLLLVDNILVHANAPGKADTRYSGKQDITTDFQNGPLLKPYRLRETRDGHEMRTLDYGKRSRSDANDLLASDFTDDDNNWTGKEYGDTAAVPNLDDAALEAHFNMEIVNDYWKNLHGRNSWDNNNGNIISYVHVSDDNGALLDNAFWDGDAMYFGDGDGAGDPPLVSIDDCGHELGHAICQTTAALVYRWESGAINEGFSDIWAACITHYALTKIPDLPGQKTEWRLFEESTGPTNVLPGLRDMSDPTVFNNPGTYKDNYWKPASFDVCPSPGSPGNDNCGVHNNSGVLNKWFFLITDGDNGNNSFGIPYHVTGIHFGKSDSIAYLTELNLTPNAGYKTVRNVSVNAAITLYGEGAEAKTVRDAWLAVGVDTAVFNMSTAPFLTNSFSTIAVGKAGCIWAGTTTTGGANTSSSGVYRYDGKKWEQANVLTNNAVQGMMSDKDGGIWIAQSGRTGAQAIAGGVNYFADSAFSSNEFYSTSDGLVSRNSRSIFVDTSRLNSGHPSVWVASLAQVTGGASSTGGVGTGLNTYIPFISNYFSKQKEGIDAAGGTGGAQTIGGNGTEVWAFASNNFKRSEIIRYDANTKDSIGEYDYTNSSGSLTQTFQAKSIYFDIKNNKWLGMQQNGLVVLDKNGIWHQVDPVAFSTILPPGTIVNNNAITGDKLGNVYIGTSNGLVWYNGGPLNQVSSYRRFTTVHGLPSNNVRGIAVDTIRYKLLLATDNGILFFDQQCASGDDCWAQIPNRKSAATSLSGGNWSDPSIWSTNKIPDQYTDVRLEHAVVVDIDGICASINVTAPGSATVKAGRKLIIREDERTIIQTISSKKY
ncbi:MAG: M4 family metallopeptidase [Ginsengibacter sp.]